MYCEKCGTQISENETRCSNCGNDCSLSKAEGASSASFHTIPKCLHCGNIGPWKVAPILRGIDYVIGIILLFFGFVPGLIYFGVVALVRSNKDNRSKICQKCGAKNMFSFEYKD